MSLHSDFDGLIPPDDASTPALTAELVPLLRAQMSATGASFSRPADVSREEHMAGSVPVRLYRPAVCGSVVLVFLHGGGWLFGDLETHDAMCARIAQEAQMAVLAVGYRLAPEHRFPAGLDDCEAGFAWMCKHAARLGFETVALGGESAGANLAAVVALRRRNRGEPQPAFQLLIHPATDLRMSSPAIDEVKGPGLDRRSMEAMRGLYLRAPDDELDPDASPALAPSLAGLARAIVLTAECDPLRDDGESYALALAAAGVETLVQRLPGLPHGFLFLPYEIPVVARAYRLLAALLRRYAQAR